MLAAAGGLYCAARLALWLARRDYERIAAPALEDMVAAYAASAPVPGLGRARWIGEQALDVDTRTAIVRAVAPEDVDVFKERLLWFPVVTTRSMEHLALLSTLPKPPAWERFRDFAGRESIVFHPGERGARERRWMARAFSTEAFRRAHATAMRGAAVACRERLLAAGGFAEEFYAAGIEIITRAAFGYALPNEEGARRAAVKAIKLAGEAAADPLCALPLGGTLAWWWHRRELAFVTRLIGDVVDARMGRGNGDGGGSGDLLDLLLQSARESPDGRVEGVPVRTWLADNVRLFLTAGSDTSAITLHWAAILLAAHPAAQAELHRELDATLRDDDDGDDDNDGDAPSFARTARLRYLDAVVRETLRLRPVLPHLLRQYTGAEFGGARLPAGQATLLVDVGLIHRRAAYFGERPDDFWPERWLNGAVREPRAFAAFSVGARACLGQGFAMLEIKTVLATLLRRHAVEPLQPGPLPRMGAPPLCAPAGAYRMRLVPRA